MDIKSIFNEKILEVFSSEIIETKNLASAFGSVCYKIILKNKKKLVLKYHKLYKNKDYPSVYYEGRSLAEMGKRFKNLFPEVYILEKNYFIMDWIEHNNIINYLSEKDFALKIAKIHSIKNKMFGFNFNTAIGGIEHNCNFEKSWISFYKINRLQMIFDLINKSQPMPSNTNQGIEKIIYNIEQFIPESKTPSLIHGDLWSGNILFNDGKLVGLIDPGIQYAEVEFELAHLLFFNTVSDVFFKHYQNYIQLDSKFRERSGIYELYYALLNVYLWDRSYINRVNNILKRFT